jgi:flagellar basal-body rod protein FlgG
MIRALYTAASGMSAQQLNLDTIANNLANSSTAGFRQTRMQFQDMLYQNMVTPGAAQSAQTVSAGLQIGLGTKTSATEVIMTQGDLNQTNNPLDIAIEGSGFFQVQRPDGTTAYTRAGSFHLNNQGGIVTSAGDLLQPPITIPPNATAVTITQYGHVNATLPGQQNPQQLGSCSWQLFRIRADWKRWERTSSGQPSPREMPLPVTRAVPKVWVRCSRGMSRDRTSTW